MTEQTTPDVTVRGPDGEPDAVVVAGVHGDEELVADEPFVPVLMSECGYRDIFGYRAHVAGETLAEARDHWTSG